jgi:D-tagatose-1,6-bisphosphate aldolase subunit GatZ/KbaZ
MEGLSVDEVFNRLRELRARGMAVGLCSVCSSHPLVIEATVRVAGCTGSPFLLEATANQVNQHGGYTGLIPDAFVKRARATCSALGVDSGLLILGGDHLGPFPWRASSSSRAMKEAEVLVRAFVRAGARKIHLDASVACADDGAVLSSEAGARRTALLCAAAEDEWKRTGGLPPVYVIGTEVPAPGGETRDHEAAPLPTAPARLRAMVDDQRRLFHEAGLEDAWTRIVAVVVQPGVEFDAFTVHRYDRNAAAPLTSALRGLPGLFFEGHSTDYQSTAALREMVEDGFVILKVGPEMTFTLREQLFGLARIEEETVEEEARSRVRETVLAAMAEDPRFWKGYYPEDRSLSYCMTYAYSDRMRYYWNLPKVAASVAALFASLGTGEIPLPLVSQHIPHICPAADIGPGGRTARELVLRGIEAQLERYLDACGSRALAEGG